MGEGREEVGPCHWKFCTQRPPARPYCSPCGLSAALMRTPVLHMARSISILFSYSSHSTSPRNRTAGPSAKWTAHFHSWKRVRTDNTLGMITFFRTCIPLSHLWNIPSRHICRDLGLLARENSSTLDRNWAERNSQQIVCLAQYCSPYTKMERQDPHQIHHWNARSCPWWPFSSSPSPFLRAVSVDSSAWSFVCTECLAFFFSSSSSVSNTSSVASWEKHTTFSLDLGCLQLGSPWERFCSEGRWGQRTKSVGVQRF